MPLAGERHPDLREHLLQASRCDRDQHLRRSLKAESPPTGQFKEALARAILDVVEGSNIRSFLNNMNDPIERRLLHDDFHKYSDKTGKNVLYTVYLLKPGEQPAPIKVAELKDKQGRLVLRFTSLNAEICEPLAFVCIIRIEHGQPVVTEKLLFFDSDTGWRVLSDSE
jgi:hypothetical protein